MKQTKKTLNKQTNTKPKEIIMENREPEQPQEPVEPVVRQEYTLGDTFVFNGKEYKVVEVLSDNKVHIKCKTAPFNSLVVDVYVE